MGTKYYIRLEGYFKDRQPYDTLGEAQKALQEGMRLGEPYGYIYECRNNILKPILKTSWTEKVDGCFVEMAVEVLDE